MAKDILLTADGDLDLSTGDIRYTDDATAQHQHDILMARPGDYRLSPRAGVAIHDFLDDEEPRALQQAIARQFAADGMTVTSINTDGAGRLDIDASYAD